MVELPRQSPADHAIAGDPARAVAAVLALRRAGRGVAARGLCRDALARNPGRADLAGLAAVLVAEGGDWGTAARLARRAVLLAPALAAAQGALSLAAKRLGDAAMASTALRRALAAAPDDAALWSNLGNLLTDLDRLAPATLACRRAILLAPDDADPLVNLGKAVRALSRPAEARGHCRRALAAEPGNVNAAWNLGLAALTMGDLEEGWRGFEARLRFPARPAPRSPAPLWEGEPIGHRTLLVVAEQGFGDTIHFCRYATVIAARHPEARVVLEAQPPLGRLLSTLSGVTVVARGDPLPPHDLQCPLLSVPARHGGTLADVPADVPYLEAPPGSLVPPADRPRIGIVWGGNRLYPNDRHRSTELGKLAPLLARDDVVFHSLQTDERRAEIAALGFADRIIDLAPQLADFADTATALAELDLLITTDTASAHLAGALARPVWVMLAHAADWRWLERRDDSPWYPTMRLFRQPRAGDWESVVAAVMAALDRWLVERADAPA